MSFSLFDQFEHHGRALLFQVRHMRLSGRLFFDMLDIRLSGFQLLLVIFFPLFKNCLGFFELAGIFGFLRGVLFKNLLFSLATSRKNSSSSSLISINVSLGKLKH